VVASGTQSLGRLARLFAAKQSLLTMRLTADVLLRTEGYLNVVRDRELSLRGHQVPAIENLAVLEDQFDCLDLTSNDIKKLDNFPLMKRVTTLLCSNNHISKVSSNIGRNLPALQCLVLSNNRIGHLYELRALAKCAALEHVALLDNPVCMHPHYRLFLVFHLCCLREMAGSVGTGGFTHGLRTLDFRKVTAEERAAAKQLFESQVGKELLEALKEEHASGALVSRSAAAAAAAGSSSSGARAGGTPALTEEQKGQVRRALEVAKTKAEVDIIEMQLHTGTFPFLAHATAAAANAAAKALAGVPAATSAPVEPGATAEAALKAPAVGTEAEAGQEQEQEQGGEAPAKKQGRGRAGSTASAASEASAGDDALKKGGKEAAAVSKAAKSSGKGKGKGNVKGGEGADDAGAAAEAEAAPAAPAPAAAEPEPELAPIVKKGRGKTGAVAAVAEEEPLEVAAAAAAPRGRKRKGSEAEAVEEEEEEEEGSKKPPAKKAKAAPKAKAKAKAPAAKKGKR